VNHADLVGLIEGGVTERGGRWADLGAGRGRSRVHSRTYLGPVHISPRSTATRGALKGLAGTAIETKVADFTRPPWFVEPGRHRDGKLASFRPQQGAGARVGSRMLRAGGKLIVVEYGPIEETPGCRTRSPTSGGNRWRLRRGSKGRAFYEPSRAATPEACIPPSVRPKRLATVTAR